MHFSIDNSSDSDDPDDSQSEDGNESGDEDDPSLPPATGERMLTRQCLPSAEVPLNNYLVRQDNVS